MTIKHLNYITSQDSRTIKDIIDKEFEAVQKVRNSLQKTRLERIYNIWNAFFDLGINEIEARKKPGEVYKEFIHQTIEYLAKNGISVAQHHVIEAIGGLSIKIWNSQNDTPMSNEKSKHGQRAVKKSAVNDELLYSSYGYTGVHNTDSWQ